MLIDEKRDSFLPSGSWIVLFWLPAETLSLKRLHGKMGKGGCKVPPTTTADDDCGDVGIAETYDNILKKEREEKKAAEPKFYWADDEEPHRRR